MRNTSLSLRLAAGALLLCGAAAFASEPPRKDLACPETTQESSQSNSLQSACSKSEEPNDNSGLNLMVFGSLGASLALVLGLLFLVREHDDQAS